jgi:signal transduction histidine kinase
MHDSVGQLLAAIGMNNSFVEAERHKLSTDAAKRIIDNNQMVEEITRQIRTISHLLHRYPWNAGTIAAVKRYLRNRIQRTWYAGDGDHPDCARNRRSCEFVGCVRLGRLMA